MTDNHDLFIFIALICGTSAVSWFVCGRFLRIAPPTAYLFMGFNLLILLACQLNILRSSQNNFWVWNMADLMVLMAIALCCAGIRRLYKLPDRRKPYRVYVLLTLASFLFIPPDAASVYWFALAFSITGTFWLGRLAWDIYAGVTQSMSARVGWLLIWPFALASFGMLVRLVLQLTGIMQVTASGVEDPVSLAYLWIYVAFSLIVNVFLFANVLTRMVLKIRYYADHDALTGANNYGKFRWALRRAVERASRNRAPLSLILLDLDHFKRINDEYGHSAGDAALKHTVGVVEQALRPDDFLARVGGEEFAILCPHTSLEEAYKRAERIREAIESQPLEVKGQQLTITGSLGCASTEQTHPRYLSAQADRAMYAAKLGGRNRVAVADDAGAESERFRTL